MHNIEKCLAIGYDQVLALFVAPSLLDESRDAAVTNLSHEEKGRVKFGIVNEINRFLQEWIDGFSRSLFLQIRESQAY